MKQPPRGIHKTLLLYGCLISASVFCLPAASRATTLTWDASGTGIPADGSGNWNAPNWYTSGTDGPWSGGNDAVFGVSNGAAGIITINGNPTVNSLTFNHAGSGNYTLTGGTITLGGTSITVNADATIDSTLAGAAGLTLSGSGTLLIDADNINGLAGPITINAGTLRMGNATALGNLLSGLTVNSGGTLDLNGALNAYTGNSADVYLKDGGLSGGGTLPTVLRHRPICISGLVPAGPRLFQGASRTEPRPICKYFSGKVESLGRRYRQ